MCVQEDHAHNCTHTVLCFPLYRLSRSSGRFSGEGNSQLLISVEFNTQVLYFSGYEPIFGACPFSLDAITVVIINSQIVYYSERPKLSVVFI